MRTEISAKFRPDGLSSELTVAGLELLDLWTDPAGDFARSLSARKERGRPREPARGRARPGAAAVSVETPVAPGLSSNQTRVSPSISTAPQRSAIRSTRNRPHPDASATPSTLRGRGGDVWSKPWPGSGTSNTRTTAAHP